MKEMNMKEIFDHSLKYNYFKIKLNHLNLLEKLDYINRCLLL